MQDQSLQVIFKTPPSQFRSPTSPPDAFDTGSIRPPRQMHWDNGQTLVAIDLIAASTGMWKP